MMEENLFTPRCIRTVSGIYVNVFEPTPEMIDIEDIAHSLSMECRFGNHLKEFYSVAEHSIHCQEKVSKKNKLAPLMHDAAEAYLQDLPRPIKQELEGYKVIEDKLMRVIADKFGFEYPLPDEVKITDDVMLKMEWEVLVLGKEVNFLFYNFNHRDSKTVFLSAFHFLTDGIWRKN